MGHVLDQHGEHVVRTGSHGAGGEGQHLCDGSGGAAEVAAVEPNRECVVSAGACLDRHTGFGSGAGEVPAVPQVAVVVAVVVGVEYRRAAVRVRVVAGGMVG